MKNAYNILSNYPDYIDHINGVELDNINNNLNSINQQQNSYNKPTRGYVIQYSNGFRPQIKFNGKAYHPYSVVHSEIEACVIQHQIETDYLKSLMGNDYYMYNFLFDRRNDLDILDLERTKKISVEEAIFRHVMRYAKDNAWYYYRYNLQNYFSQYHIPIPTYSLDNQGFMIHPITGKKLCPF